jgi:pimeloyl-ACP methyl ester carboxylesterase
MLPEGRTVEVDGVRTYVHDLGEGPVVLLLHGGAWGECARTTWTSTAPALAAAGYRVVAPDWLGFGGSDKLRDFVDLPGRMLRVLAGALGALGVDRLHAAVGLSMGGSHLLRDLVSPQPLLPADRAVLVAAGGAPIAPPVRRRLMDYDGTLESMRAQVALACADPSWTDGSRADAEEYLALRHRMSLEPGAYEWFSSLTLRSPTAPPPPPGDPVPYERIGVPVLLVEGEHDPLKPSGWAEPVAARIPDARVEVVKDVGHLAPIEDPAAFEAVLLAFLPPPAAAPAIEERP